MHFFKNIFSEKVITFCIGLSNRNYFRIDPQSHINFEPLTRDEKRIKKNLFIRFLIG